MINILMAAIYFTISVYDLHFQTSDGSMQSFGAYQGKKILIVNIATGSDKISQLAQLKQLQQQYADSLLVLAFPSNSFGNEPRDNNEIAQFCTQQYGINFLIGAKGDVRGPNKLTIYTWFSDKTMNGIMNAPVVGDFQKFLLDKTGEIIGSFSPETSPLDPKITNAITEF